MSRQYGSEDLLTRAEVAVFTHSSESTVERWVRDGLRERRIGRRNLYRFGDLTDFLDWLDESEQLQGEG